MGVVVACFLGGVWLFRNWQRFTVRGARIPKLQVIESRSLGPRTGLYVIGYEQQRFLIATTPNGISMLSSLPPGSPDEVTAPAAAPQIDFAAILARTLSFRGKPGVSEA
jgi:flagellar biogenesis protein FliO